MANSNDSSKEATTAILNPKVKEHTEEDPKRACDFCQRTEINKLMWGPMYSLEDVTVHYFCMVRALYYYCSSRIIYGLILWRTMLHDVVGLLLVNPLLSTIALREENFGLVGPTNTYVYFFKLRYVVVFGWIKPVWRR